MAADGSRTTAEPHVESMPAMYGDDRCCRNCREAALAFDPSAGRARCRSCGELA